MVSNDSKGAASFENDPAIVEKIRSAFDMAINNGSEVRILLDYRRGHFEAL